ncbi:V-type ATP synthase subunit I [Candidatus Woesearchaeota archaeon]|nr:V-type ATP synthase subunit I [Candidatus Woesearchaeota archaeon]
MLTPHKMDSVVITGPNSVMEHVIKALHNMKVLHIVEHSDKELADIGSPLKSANKLSEILVNVRALIAALGIKKEDKTFKLKKGLLEIESTTKKLSEEVRMSQEELKKTEELIARNHSVGEELDTLKNINLPLEVFSSYKSLTCFAGYVRDENTAASIKVELSLITSRFMMFQSPIKKGHFIALFIDSKSKDSANHVLSKGGFSPVNFMNISNLKGSASGNMEKIEKEIAKLQSKSEEITRRMHIIANDFGGFLIMAEEFLSEQLEKAEAPLKFASTKSSFLIKGWVPSDELTESIEKLSKAAKNRIFVNFEPAKKHDKVPVKLKNPTPVRQFEFFLDLYSYPSYMELDPTLFIFLTFPIFFGIMLGDVGYGIVTLLLFWILKRKMPKASNFFNILMLASVSSIIFGLIFGEFFGFEFMHPIVERSAENKMFMPLAIAIGIVHVNIGLIVGFINEMKSHGFKHAFFAKASWFVLEIGAVLAALSIFKIISLHWSTGVAVILLSLIMLFIGEGIKGPIESLSIFTNILSYARLMAIGLSSVILAVIINESAGKMMHTGGVFIVLGIVILVLGHIINIMLGLLGSFLHSLRLHYVEFFSKFFHGGADKYRPFGVRQ